MMPDIERRSVVQEPVTLASPPQVAIIILNWNRPQDSIECLNSVYQINYANYEVVLIDNGSTADSVEQITEWSNRRFPIKVESAKFNPPGRSIPIIEYSGPSLGARGDAPKEDVIGRPAFNRLALIRNKENLGFTGGVNVGISYALSHERSADFLFLLNNDARLDPNCVNHCVRVARREEAGVVGALIKSLDGSEILFSGTRFPAELFMENRVRLRETLGDYWPVDSTQGSGMLVSRSLLVDRKENLGYFFDPTLFMYCDELELCIYAKKRGHAIFLAGNAVVYHGLAQSSGGGRSPLSYYYVTRNRVHLAAKFLPWWLRLLFLFWYVPSRLLRALQRSVEGKPSVSAAILEGLVDGYRGVTGKWRKHPA